MARSIDGHNPDGLVSSPYSSGKNGMYVSYPDLQTGFKGAAYDLIAKIHNGHDTLAKIVHRRCGPGDDEAAYLQHLTQATGFDPNARLTADHKTIAKLVTAIAKQETSASLSSEALNQSIEGALADAGRGGAPSRSTNDTYVAQNETGGEDRVINNTRRNPNLSITRASVQMGGTGSAEDQRFHYPSATAANSNEDPDREYVPPQQQQPQYPAQQPYGQAPGGGGFFASLLSMLGLGNLFGGQQPSYGYGPQPYGQQGYGQQPYAQQVNGTTDTLIRSGEQGMQSPQGYANMPQINRPGFAPQMAANVPQIDNSPAHFNEILKAQGINPKNATASQLDKAQLYILGAPSVAVASAGPSATPPAANDPLPPGAKRA